MQNKITLTVDKVLSEGDLHHTYSALNNMIDKNGDIAEFTVKNKLGISPNNPIQIECQPSYDGTVNLIINDDKNPPRLINTRFSKIENNRYKIINRNQTQQSNLYSESNVDLESRLFRNINSFPIIDYIGVNYSGKMKGGNYVFYIKFADSDENETDIVSESGIISVFNGTIQDVPSISGTLLDEETDKSIKLRISNIDTTFPKMYIYYSRETSDLNGFRIFEIRKLNKAYDIVDSNQTIIISGYEDETILTESDLNINYLNVAACKTQAQVQNMLFFGNIESQEIKHKELQNISYYINVSLKQKSESIGWIDPLKYKSADSNLEYYDPKNIYYNLGYWPGELYRLGIVYILNDDSLTPVFNLRGCLFQNIGDSNLTNTDIYDSEKQIPSESFIEGVPYANTFGVFKNPDESFDNSIINYSEKKVRPWYYQMKFTTKMLIELRNLGVKGYFFVRQKRLPLILCQGLSLGIDKSANIPCVYNDSLEEYTTQSFVDDDFVLKETSVSISSDRTEGSALLSVEAAIIPEIQSKFNGGHCTIKGCTSQGSLNVIDNHYLFNFINDFDETSYSFPCTFVKENTPFKYVKGFGFSSRVGSELTAKEFGFFGATAEEKLDSSDRYKKLVRGIYTSFIGVCGKIVPNTIYNIYTQTYSNGNLKDYILIRGSDNSPFYAVSNRNSLNTDTITIYRGDCFTSTVSMRLNRNFRDPDTPINDTIIDSNCWKDNYSGITDTSSDDWLKINRADVNAVPLGTWISYKCLSTYNLGLRSEDDSDLSEMALLSTPKSFYPYRSMDNRSSFNISESGLLNRGLSSTTSRKWNSPVQNVPYIKNLFDNRIMFSNVFTEENFRNGYRIFQGLSYKDIDRQYGAIVKLLPWGTNLLCVFEHGLGIIPINEKALIQTSTNQSIHMYGAGVIQNQISLISADFGSIWQDSIIRTPLAVYGVDTYAKKIWKYSDKGFETISDMKIQRFLNEHIKLTESDKYPTISIKNVKTHYNNYKGDVMFTFYNDREDEVWNFCFNERMNKWITRYSWTPLFSENIDNIFYSLDQQRAKVLAHIYNNRNCTYGLKCMNNKLISDPNINEYPFEFVGSVISPNEYKINSIKAKYINEGVDKELKINHGNISGIEISDNKLTINYSSLEEWFVENYGISVPMHLFIKIGCIFDDHVKQEVVGLINYSYPNFEEYSINGFYVHGRSGIFDELNYSDANLTNQIIPTKWYDKQEPFEFEFVVNGDVGFHKIFDNLVIISNNVQPKQFEFSIIGDVYDFNKEGIFRSKEFNEDEWQTANKRKYNDIDYKVSHSFDNCTIEWDNNQNNYWIKLSQDTKNIKDFGRVQGNIHYKEDSWYVTIDPIKFRNKYKIAEDISTGDLQSTRVRDKFMKIRVKYSGEDLVIITALNTLLTISHS